MKHFFSILVLTISFLSSAQETRNPQPQISVSGEGKIKVIPDQAEIVVGFQNSGKDAKEVKNLNDEVLDKVLKYLKKIGIQATDYTTSSVSLHKAYDYEKKKATFQANQTVNITLKDLKRYDELMAGLNEAGINLIQGVEFKSSKLATYESDARKTAILNAKLKAVDYVTAIGQKIGKAIAITDATLNFYPQPMYKGNVMTMAAADSVESKETLAVGEIVVTANVNVTFELE
jgi:uncharacterized protein YggE